VTYAQVIDVPVPVEIYDALHAEILRGGGDTVDGLLVHIGRSDMPLGLDVVVSSRRHHRCHRRRTRRQPR
jgi:hypothetical protein